jgi:hypothetical protein
VIAKSKVSEAQIASALKKAEDGTTIGEAHCKAGINDATLNIAAIIAPV